MITIDPIKYEDTWFAIPRPYTSPFRAGNISLILNKFSVEFNIQFITARWRRKDDGMSDNISTDITDLLSAQQLINLQNDPSTYFIWENDREGWDPTELFAMIYHNCNNYSIDPKKMIFISSNLDNDRILKMYNINHNITTSIKILGFLSFKITENKYTEYLQEQSTDAILTQYQSVTHKTYSDKHVLSLSRRPHWHRNLLNLLLFSKPLIRKHAIISQDVLSNETINELYAHTKYPIHIIHEWNKHLPLIIDDDDFSVNKDHHLNMKLQLATLYQIIGETTTIVTANGGLFYSEKTFKPMRAMQPFIIFGQQYCNRRLAESGFKLYENWFNYAFDDEPDTVKRCNMIVTEVHRIEKILKAMSTKDQIAWRFKDINTLIHNYEKLIDCSHEEYQIHALLKTIQQEINV